MVLGAEPPRLNMWCVGGGGGGGGGGTTPFKNFFLSPPPPPPPRLARGNIEVNSLLKSLPISAFTLTKDLVPLEL